MKPIDGGRMNELPWIIPTGSHRGADDVRQVPAPEHIPGSVDLHIDALSLVDRIDVQDHSFTARVDIMMEAGDTDRAVVGHGCRHAIELSTKKRRTRRNVKCTVEENRVLSSYPCRTDPADFGITVDNDGRVILGIALQEDKVIGQGGAR